MSTFRLRGGRVHDPANGVAGAVRDIVVRDGRIGAGDEPDAREIDVSGMIVMAGGIDMHSHIGGAKMNLARLMLPEDHRDHAHGHGPHERHSSGHCTPGTLAAGERYARMGYTAAFEPAMPISNARHAHMEMGDTPVVDHGAYVLLGNDELLLQLLAQGADFESIRDYVGWVIASTRALGVKVVNAAGISAFKFNQRRLDVDDPHSHYGVTPRSVLRVLARALTELGVPHPLHVHASNLGVPGNIASTLATIDAVEGLPVHMTHVQFHSYGTEGPRKFSSAARELAAYVNAHPNVSIDVGQVMFGQTVTASADTMMQIRNAALGTPRKWGGADVECDSGCGVVPFRYREQSFVNALQWAIGLELFLSLDDPWRVGLTTDHPNGAPFTSYPHLIRLLMDRSYRNACLDRLHPDVAEHSELRGMTRELSLDEIAIMTRAGPARLLGLADRGHLGEGAVADIAVYRQDDADVEAMFTTPEYVFKSGELVARRGELVAAPVGGVLYATPEYDRGIERTIAQYADAHLALDFRNMAIDDEELAACSNGGRTFPTPCTRGKPAS